MRKSKAAARLRAGEPVRMCVLGHFIPSFIHHAAHFGYDCIWLDLEHRCFSEREVQSLLATFHAADIDCLLRPPTKEKTRLCRYLEDGASGLLVPLVSTADQARQLVDAVKFPPVGERGLDGAGLDSNFYLHGGPGEYVDHASRESFLVVQIETPEAVHNASDIAAVEGVDGLFVGPGDLQMRIDRTDAGGMTVEEAYQTVAHAAAKHGKAWGCPAGSAEQVAKLHGQGAQLIAHGNDFITLMNMLRNCAEDLEAAYGSST